MNRLLKLLLFFGLPVFVFFVVLEVMVVRIPNNFEYKYFFVKQHGGGISTIAIGHSQILNGLLPEFNGDSTFNMSSAGQRFVDDYYILRETLDYMPNLKTVILPLSYLDIVDADADTTLRDLSVYYHEYMNIDYDGALPLEYYYECFRVRRAITKLWQYYYDRKPVLSCRKYGEEFKESNEDLSSTINQLYSFTVKEGRKFKVKDSYYLEKILALLNKNNARPILVSPPFYWKVFNDENVEQTAFLHQYAEKLIKDYGILYIDLQKDSSFVDRDFADSAHLSERGAAKFSRMIFHMI